MEQPAVIAAIVAAVTSIVLALLKWVMDRRGLQLAGRKDLREEVKDLWARIEQLETKNRWWEEHYKQLEIDSDERYRRLNADWERRYRQLEGKYDTLKDEVDKYQHGRS